MGIRESDTELKAKMNAAISSMKDDGSLNALIKNTLSPDKRFLIVKGKEGLSDISDFFRRIIVS